MSVPSQADRDRAKSADEASKKDREAGVPEYKVSVPSAPASAPTPTAVKAAATTGPKKVAVFVAHGMGQPIPFQTLDAIAECLRRRAGDNLAGAQKPVSRAIKFEDQWLQRIELKLQNRKGEDVEAHVYEAYWAPLTEGRINIRQVIGFLAGAGRNGLKNGMGTFRRWMFDSYMPFAIPVTTVLSLLVALAAVAALVIMNSAIALVAAGRAFLSTSPAWLSDSLLTDLTTTFDIVVTTMVVFGVFLTIAHATRRLNLWGWIRSIRSALTLISFGVTMFVVILAGLLILFFFFGHVRALPTADAFWYNLVARPRIDAFNNSFDATTWTIVKLVAIGFAAWWGWKIILGIVKDTLGADDPWPTLITAVVFLALVIAVLGLVLRFRNIFVKGGADSVWATPHALAWPLVVAASAYVRLVLVQFVGDVAIYVMPYKLDAFNSLRKEIKDLVYKIARAVYALGTETGSRWSYDEVIVVGHSLGSVIVYDALNRMILEDEASGKKLDVVRRTPLFVTFGSPLDKTAYIFAVQGNGTTEARESVAAAVQPMIQDYKFRPARWVNIHSPWDIISGSLEFYDPALVKASGGVAAPTPNESQRVVNTVDRDATTLLIAHTEYWGDNALVNEIYSAL